jgi:hypothetical protein
LDCFAGYGGDGVVEEAEVQRLETCKTGAAGKRTLRPEMDNYGFERGFINDVIDFY